MQAWWKLPPKPIIDSAELPSAALAFLVLSALATRKGGWSGSSTLYKTSVPGKTMSRRLSLAVCSWSAAICWKLKPLVQVSTVESDEGRAMVLTPTCKSLAHDRDFGLPTRVKCKKAYCSNLVFFFSLQTRLDIARADNSGAQEICETR